MEYENYKDDDTLIKNIQVGHMGYKLRIKKMYGYVYRGDVHQNIVLSLDPKFYGSLESASKYMTGNNNFMKRYTTMKKLNILDFSNVDDNFTNLLDFFENEFVKESTESTDSNSSNPNNLVEMKIMVYLVQLCYGIIIDKKIRKYGMDDDTILKYLKYRGISDGNVSVSEIIDVIYTKYPTIELSRFGVRQFDKLVVKLLRKYLKKFNIDGVLYIEPSNPNKENLLCTKVNILYGSTTCPPSEVCIFNPHTDLGAVEIWKMKDNKLIYLKHYFKRNIRNRYKKLSLYDLYRISLLNKKVFN